jgi:hypothetical protein
VEEAIGAGAGPEEEEAVLLHRQISPLFQGTPIILLSEQPVREEPQAITTEIPVETATLTMVQ